MIGIEVIAHHALSCHRIQVGRFDDTVTIGTQSAVSLLVGENKHNVGSIGHRLHRTHVDNTWDFLLGQRVNQFDRETLLFKAVLH